MPFSNNQLPIDHLYISLLEIGDEMVPTIHLYTDMNFSFRRMRSRVTAEFDIRAVIIS
jgi:hypothetical protein